MGNIAAAFVKVALRDLGGEICRHPDADSLESAHARENSTSLDNGPKFPRGAFACQICGRLILFICADASRAGAGLLSPALSGPLRLAREVADVRAVRFEPGDVALAQLALPELPALAIGVSGEHGGAGAAAADGALC